jgi:membrane protein
MPDPHKLWIVEQLESNTLVAKGPLGALWRYVSRDMWKIDIEHVSWWKRTVLRTARIVFLAGRSFVGDRCVLQAGALTYVTVLSLVPLLAFAFAMLKGLGFYNELRAQRIDPFLDTLLSTGPQADPNAPVHGAFELRTGVGRVLDLVDQTNLKGLGFVGLIVLLLAVVRLLGSIESSFNQIWGVRKSRSWLRKLSDYMTIVIVTPLFLVVAIGVTTAAQNAGVVTFLREELSLGWALEALLKALPVLIGWLAFTLVYLVMPNRRCKFVSALIGGFIGGTLWQIALVLLIRFQIGIANYNAIYAGFAALPVFLVWVQTSWVIVLLGAEIAFAHESEPDFRGIATHQFHHHAFREQVALRSLTRVCDAFLSGETMPSTSSIAAALGVSPREVREVLDDLRQGGLVAIVEGAVADSNAYVPARDPGKITVVDVIAAMRGEGLDERVAALGELDRHVDKLLAQMRQEAASSAYNRSLRDLVEESRRRATADSPATAARVDVQPS